MSHPFSGEYHEDKQLEGENMSKHTPRPWQIVVLDGDTYIQKGDGTQKNSGSALLARIQRTNEEQKANAKLIAAAPELLEACQYALDHAGDMEAQEGVLDLLRRAVYKAEGR